MGNHGERKATIVHAIPGRVRVRLDRSLRSPDFLRSLVDALSQLEGVNQIRVNPTTGSLLLLYDSESLDLQQLFLAAGAANVTVVVPGASAEAPSIGETTPLAQGINSAVRRLDRAVFEFTGGRVDVRTLFPLGLGAAALRQIATSEGNLTTAPWYVLLWYSFEAFTRYNPRRREMAAEDAASRAGQEP